MYYTPTLRSVYGHSTSVNCINNYSMTLEEVAKHYNVVLLLFIIITCWNVLLSEGTPPSTIFGHQLYCLTARGCHRLSTDRPGESQPGKVQRWGGSEREKWFGSSNRESASMPYLLLHYGSIQANEQVMGNCL